MCHLYYSQIIIYQTICNLQTCVLLNMASQRASTSNAAFMNVKMKRDHFSGSLKYKSLYTLLEYLGESD